MKSILSEKNKRFFFSFIYRLFLYLLNIGFVGKCLLN